MRFIPLFRCGGRRSSGPQPAAANAARRERQSQPARSAWPGISFDHWPQPLPVPEIPSQGRNRVGSGSLATAAPARVAVRGGIRRGRRAGRCPTARPAKAPGSRKEASLHLPACEHASSRRPLPSPCRLAIPSNHESNPAGPARLLVGRNNLETTKTKQLETSLKQPTWKKQPKNNPKRIPETS